MRRRLCPSSRESRPIAGWLVASTEPRKSRTSRASPTRGRLRYATAMATARRQGGDRDRRRVGYRRGDDAAVRSARARPWCAPTSTRTGARPRRGDRGRRRPCGVSRRPTSAVLADLEARGGAAPSIASAGSTSCTTTPCGRAAATSTRSTPRSGTAACRSRSPASSTACGRRIPALLARGGGSIITTSSVDGLFGEIMAAPYATAKAAVINLTRTVAVEYGRREHPRQLHLPRRGRDAAARPCWASSRRSRAPSSRRSTPSAACLRPEEIANVALFLASDESSADHRRGHRGRRRPDRRARGDRLSALRRLLTSPGPAGAAAGFPSRPVWVTFARSDGTYHCRGLPRTGPQPLRARAARRPAGQAAAEGRAAAGRIRQQGNRHRPARGRGLEGSAAATRTDPSA